jgi:hypothetical protein
LPRLDLAKDLMDQIQRGSSSLSSIAFFIRRHTGLRLEWAKDTLGMILELFTNGMKKVGCYKVQKPNPRKVRGKALRIANKFDYLQMKTQYARTRTLESC